MKERQKGWWWLSMDEDGMGGDGAGWMDVVVVWCWLYTPFSSLGGVVRAGGEVERSPFPLS